MGYFKDLHLELSNGGKIVSDEWRCRLDVRRGLEYGLGHYVYCNGKIIKTCLDCDYEGDEKKSLAAANTVFNYLTQMIETQVAGACLLIGSSQDFNITRSSLNFCGSEDGEDYEDNDIYRPESDQVCPFCSSYFTVTWISEPGFREQEEYYCPSCNREVGTVRASNVPVSFLIKK